MLSRLLHRTIAPELTPDQKMSKIARTLNTQFKPTEQALHKDVDLFVELLKPLSKQEGGIFITDTILYRMAFSNGNTSYIEPYVEAAYRLNHPDRDFVGKLYANFARENEPHHLVHKLLDGRFYNIDHFPAHAFALLGIEGVTVPKNVQDRLLYRALASTTPIELIKPALDLLKLDPNAIKDAQQRTPLHILMSEGQSHNQKKSLDHMLNRAKALGVVPAPDIFGRYPEELGTAQGQWMYYKYFPTRTQQPINALATYLQTTLHSFDGVHTVGSRDREVYLKQTSPVHSVQKVSLFEHVFKSNDMAVIGEMQRLIAPTTRPNVDIESSLAYVFIDRYVCGKDAKPEIANQVFALLQEEQPQDLSTALGYFLMRSEAYYKNYDVDVSQLAQYTPAIENIMAYQAQMGLVDLLKLEKPKLDTIAAGPELPGMTL